MDNNELLRQNFSPSMATNLKNTLLTSADVERSFTIYKSIITDHRDANTIEVYLNSRKYNLASCQFHVYVYFAIAF